MRQEEKPWYDDECRRAVERRNEERIKMINHSMTANTEENKLAKREARCVCQRKKPDSEKSQLEEIEESCNKKQVRKFYQDVQNKRKGFQPRNDFCRDKEGNTVSEGTEIRKRWAEYFSDMFKTSEIEDTSNIEKQMYQRAETQIEPPNLEEILEVIHSFKNNKAPRIDMIPIELIKIRATELLTRIHNLIIKVWEEEKMPEELNMAHYCPIHKKEGKTLCSNYRAIALLDVVYKVFCKIISKRLEPYMEDIIGNYQAGFRRNKSTPDQTFAMKQIL
jgi:hypothetical protein